MPNIALYFMAEFALNLPADFLPEVGKPAEGRQAGMNILVANINRCGQKGLSLKVRHKAFAFH